MARALRETPVTHGRHARAYHHIWCLSIDKLPAEHYILWLDQCGRVDRYAIRLSGSIARSIGVTAVVGVTVRGRPRAGAERGVDYGNRASAALYSTP